MHWKALNEARLIELTRSLDQRILAISPKHDVFLLRLLAAVPAVVFLAADALYRVPFFYWLGVPFYLCCLLLYAHGLMKSLLILRHPLAGPGQ